MQPLIDDMLETLYASDNGIGLASTQVGRKEAVVVSGTNQAMGQEGCLSVPDYYTKVARYTSVVVSALDRHGTPITIESDDFLAIVMQHEIDHLAGQLFIDYLSPLKHHMALKKVNKYLSNRLCRQSTLVSSEAYSPLKLKMIGRISAKGDLLTMSIKVRVTPQI